MSLIRYIRRLWLILSLTTLFACGGCRVGPDYAPPQTVLPDAWHQRLEEGEFMGTDELDRWWTLFDDEILNELILAARSNNPTLEGAYHRIGQARAQRCVVASARIPQLTSDASFQTQVQSANALGIIAGAFTRDLWALAGNVAWEVDVFGRVYRQVESADANVNAQIESYRDVLVTLYGDVAQNYVQVRTLQEQLGYAKENVAIQRRALDLARRRVEGGVAPNLDEFQAESNLAATESEIPQIELQLHRTLNRLAILLGNCPGSLHDPLSLVAPIPTVPASLPLIIPCEMVRQRPDVRNAERLVAARTADVGVATSELFPRFSIGGNFGWSAQKFSDVFSSGSFGYGLGPSVSWPIFVAGRIKCNIRGTEAAVQEAIANYEQTVLLALEEVENAIVGFNKERERREALAQTVESAEATLKSVLALYREGKTDFLNVLDSQRRLFLAQNELAITEGLIVVELVTLYRALGGGWEPLQHEFDTGAQIQCPPRGDPSVVEDIPIKDQSSQYFGLGTETEDDEDRQDQQPELGSPAAAESLPSPQLDTKKEDRRDAFDKLIEELEQRLKTKPE